MGISLKKTASVLAIVVFLALAVAALLYDRNVKQENVVKLKDELKDFIVLPVSLNNRVYIVENGNVKLDGKDVSVFTEERVLRIAYASVLNRLEPIFGIEGTDPDKLKKSVEDLDASLKEIASLYGEEDAALIRENLYPIAFLKQLAETEKTRQELLLAPSSENAGGYYGDLGKLLGLNASYSKQLETFYKKNKDRLSYKFNFFDGYGTVSTYTSALEKNVISLDGKLAELKKRESCLNGYSSECPSLKAAFVGLSGSMGDNTDIKYGPLTNEIKDNIKIVRAYLGNVSLDSPADTKTTNPLIAIDQSDCFRDAQPAYYQSWMKSDKDKNGFFTINFVNDLYFRAVDNNPSRYDSSLRSAGLDYLYQPAANLYMCQSVGSDLSRSITMDTLRNMLSGNPLFLNDEIKKASPDAYNLENKIIAGDILYESEFDSYIEGLKSLLLKYGESGLSEIIGKEKMLYAEKLISIAGQKSPRFDETIRYAISNNAIVNTYIKGGLELPLYYLFISRSYPPLLLLSYNESADKNPMKLTVSASSSLANFGLLSYNKFLKGKYSERKILEMMKLGEKIGKLN